MNAYVINYCRLCAAVLNREDFLMNLQLDAGRLNDASMKLNRINAYVDFCDTALPKTVCLVCLKTLDDAFYFVQTIEQAQSKFKAIFSPNIACFSSIIIHTPMVGVSGLIVDEKQLVSNNHNLQDTKSLNNETPSNVEQHFHHTPPSDDLNNFKIKLESNEKCLAAHDVFEDVYVPEVIMNSSTEIKNETPENIEVLPRVTYNSENGLPFQDIKNNKIEAITKDFKTKTTKDEEVKKTYKKKKKKVSLDKPEFESETDPKSWKSFHWICSICATQFSTVEELKNHSVKYHNRCNTFRCPDCNSQKLRLNAFIKHMKCHRNNLKKSCYKCFRKFKSAIQLSKHSAGHKDTEHICSGCNTTFTSSEELENHTKSYYDSWKINSVSSECLTCHIKFEKRSLLWQHLKTHKNVVDELNHTCDICGKGYNAYSKLRNHKAEVHENEKPFQCDSCKAWFKTKTYLSDHFLRHHDDRRPFVCDYDLCGRSFKFKKQLKDHYKVHMDVLPFSCSVCNKAFRLKPYLKTHMRLHTGAKPFSCTMCPRQFANSANYHKHKKRRHKVGVTGDSENYGTSENMT